VAWVAGAGLVVNGATALLFMRGRERDLNLRGAFLHMVSDAALSFGVLLAALAIAGTGQVWLDPAMSLVIVVVIAAGTWGLLRQSLNLALDAVPEGMNEADVAGYLGNLPGVAEVHDLHIWALSTTQTAVTAHLVQVSDGHGETIVLAAVDGLRTKFGIGHCTIQIETPAGAARCGLRATEIV
jgi:cobalt-zinc-cadmium efflux system protein